MGLRIEREEFVNKTFRLNVKLVREVEVVCSQQNISMNRFVDIALRYALEHLEDGEGKE
jgi:predicted HicB family RNase H-like nuclease